MSDSKQRFTLDGPTFDRLNLSDPYRNAKATACFCLGFGLQQVEELMSAPLRQKELESVLATAIELGYDLEQAAVVKREADVMMTLMTLIKRKKTNEHFGSNGNRS